MNNPLLNRTPRGSGAYPVAPLITSERRRVNPQIEQKMVNPHFGDNASRVPLAQRQQHAWIPFLRAGCHAFRITSFG
jgi:hypothetical protein